MRTEKYLAVMDQKAFSKCSQTYERSGLYVIEFNNGECVKIGVSKNLSSRLQSYTSPWVKPITRIQCYKHNIPIQLERYAKSVLHKYKVAGSTECFTNISFEQVLDLLEQSQLYKNTQFPNKNLLKPV